MKSAVIVRVGWLAAIAALTGAGAAHAESPVVQVTQAKGLVEYSRDGERWRPIKRAKYLYNGYRVRTGADSSAVIVNETSGRSRGLSEDTVIAVDAREAHLVEGELRPIGDVAANDGD